MMEQRADQPPIAERESPLAHGVSTTAGKRVFFLAQQQPNGSYSVTLTDKGVAAFETSLAIADDLGGNTRISDRSTIADIMERTATREELSEVLRREDDGGMLRQTRRVVLQRKLRGSEKPSVRQATISHIGKALIVAVIAYWALMQFAAAIQDVAAIPGILANIPSDILHLHPTSAITEVGNKISDAGTRVLFGAIGVGLTYVVAVLIRPFRRMYRKDQLLPGERLLLRFVSWALRRADTPAPRRAAQ